MRSFPVVLLLLALAGCRPADPMEWKVSASSPNDYNRWSEDTLPKLDESLRREYVYAFNLLASRSPTLGLAKHMDEEHNALCRRINRRTVREVIVDAYGAERDKLLERISTESAMMLRNAKQTAATRDAATERRFTAVREAQQANVDRMNERLAQVEARLKELSARSMK